MEEIEQSRYSPSNQTNQKQPLKLIQEGPVLSALEQFSRRIDSFLPQGQNDKAILLLGDYQSGKTSILNYLNGAEFKSIIDDYDTIIGLQLLKPGKQILLSQNNEKEETTLPNLSRDRELTIIEVPDLAQTLEGDSLIIAQLSTAYLLHKFKNYHFVFLFSSEELTSAQTLQEMVKQQLDLLEVQLNSQQFKRAVSVIITKVDANSDDQIQQFRQFEKQIQQQANNNNKQFYIAALADAIQTRIYLFSNDPTLEQGSILREALMQSQYINSALCRLKPFQNNKQLQWTTLEQLEQSLKVLAELLLVINSSISSNKHKSVYPYLNWDQKISEQYLILYDELIELLSEKDKHFNTETLTLSPLNTTTEENMQKKEHTKNIYLLPYSVYIVQKFEKVVLGIQQLLPKEYFQKEVQKVLDLLYKAKLLVYGLSISKDKLQRFADNCINHRAFGGAQVQTLLKKKSLSKFCSEKGLTNLISTKKSVGKIEKSKKDSNSNKKSYESLFIEYKEKPLEQIIKVLPNKILKFDLMHRALVKMVQNNASRNEFQQKIIVKELCKVLESYGMYQEAISFFMVIPDFNRVQELLQEAYSSDHTRNVYFPNSSFPNCHMPRRFIEQVRDFALQNMRDYLATKCNNFLLQKFGVSMDELHNNEKCKANIINSSYEERLENYKNLYSKGGTFMNYDNVKYQYPLSESIRKRIVEKVLHNTETNANQNHTPGINIRLYEFLCRNIQFDPIVD